MSHRLLIGWEMKKIAPLKTNVSLSMKNQQTVGLGKIVGDLCLYPHGGLNAVENKNDDVSDDDYD